MKRITSLRLALAFFALAAGFLTLRAAEVARIAFAAGQEEFELSAAAGGAQTLSVAAAQAEVQWADPLVGHKLSRGQLTLTIPVAAGESIVSGKPQPAAGGGTLIVFSRVAAASATPVVILASPPPPVVTVVRAPVPAPNPPVASPLAVAAVAPKPASAEATPELKAAIEKMLPGPLTFDPLGAADFAIPESPGAAVLDQTAQIIKPAAPRETVTSLLSHFEDGALKTGFSVAIVPYTLFRDKPVSLFEYTDKAKPMTRFLTRLQVSLAAKTGAAAAGATTTPAIFGAGVSGVFFDDSDPRMNESLINGLRGLFNKTWQATPEQEEAMGRGELVPPTQPPQDKLDAYQQMVAAARKAQWNARAMGFGYAVRLKSASGKIEDAKEDGGGAWLNYSRPGFGSLQSSSQFLLTASYRYHDAYTRDGVSGVEDNFNLAAQLRVGTRDFNGYGQAVYHWRQPKGLPRLSETTVEFGLEKKMFDGVWLNLGWTNDKSLGGDSAMKAGLRYGFGQAASLPAKNGP